MARLNDPRAVAREYSSEAGLQARRSLYETVDGPDVKQELFRAVLGRAPEHVLEVGPGTGELAAELITAGITDYQVIDISPRMVELARERGITAQVADIQALPFADRAFDCVIAAWMLYHVPDLHRGLAEVARVLRPGGCLIATTNSERHLSELWALADQERWELPFTAENGAGALRRHFAAVEAMAVEAWVTVADAEAVRSYISRSPSRSHLASRVGDLPGPLRTGARACIFIANKA